MSVLRGSHLSCARGYRELVPSRGRLLVPSKGFYPGDHRQYKLLLIAVTSSPGLPFVSFILSVLRGVLLGDRIPGSRPLRVGRFPWVAGRSRHPFSSARSPRPALESLLPFASPSRCVFFSTNCRDSFRISGPGAVSWGGVAAHRSGPAALEVGVCPPRQRPVALACPT